MSTIAELFGTKVPIIQAPMAGSQLADLTVAASEAGALGSLPCAMITLEGMRKELASIKARTQKPVNVNFFCHREPAPDAAREAAWRRALAPYYAEFGIDAATIAPGPGRAPFSKEAAAALAEFKPAVVSFHFGLPDEALIAPLRAWGAKIIASATTVDEARWLESRRVDAIIAQGLEAGGHRGMFLTMDLTTQVGTLSLVPQIVRAVKTPVIAAGGIADRKGVVAAMALGAAGVQVGTAFLLCTEAITSAPHRAALKSDGARHTALTTLYTGRPTRVIVNRLVRELGALNAASPEFPLATSALAPLREKAPADFSPLTTGQNTTGCREAPAADIVRELAGI